MARGPIIRIGPYIILPNRTEHLAHSEKCFRLCGVEALTKVIGYVRVSSTVQAEEGVSLEAQKTRLQAYCVAMGLELVGIEVDAGLSAKSLNRPGLQAALGALESGKASGLLVVKLDRLTRSVKDLGILIEDYFASRFSLFSLGDSIDTRSASGRMMLNILTSVTQWEREAGSERTKAALSHIKASGRKLGHPFMGEVIGESVRLAKELYATGQYSHRSLADELNRLNMPTAQGGKWWPRTVRVALSQ